MQAKDHAAEVTIPLLPKGKLERHSNNPEVIAARKKINDLTHRYSVNKSKVIRKRLQEAKHDLEQQYKVLEQEYLTSLIEETEKEFKASNTARAWKVVSMIVGSSAPSCFKLLRSSIPVIRGMRIVRWPCWVASVCPGAQLSKKFSVPDWTAMVISH